MISTARPTQSFPPAEGGGLLHFRSLFCVPAPQVFVHAEKGPHGPNLPLTMLYYKTSHLMLNKSVLTHSFEISLYYLCLPGQGRVLHSLASCLAPIQSFPPAEGGGLLHFLSRFCNPVPHVFVHLE